MYFLSQLYDMLSMSHKVVQYVGLGRLGFPSSRVVVVSGNKRVIEHADSGKVSGSRDFRVKKENINSQLVGTIYACVRYVHTHTHTHTHTTHTHPDLMVNQESHLFFHHTLMRWSAVVSQPLCYAPWPLRCSQSVLQAMSSTHKLNRP